MSYRNPSPVSRFPAEMINALVQGAKSEVKIPLETRRDCTTLRQKLYMLRAAMKREQHYYYRIAERAEIVIVPRDTRLNGKDDPHFLILRPANVEFVDALREAGVEATDTEELGDTAPPPPLPQVPVQETDYMDILRRSRDSESGDEENEEKE